MVRCMICGESTVPLEENPEAPVVCSLRCHDEREERERVAELRADAARHEPLPRPEPWEKGPFS